MKAHALAAVMLAAAGTMTGVSASAQQQLSLAEAQAEARTHAPDVADLEARVRGAEAVAAQARRRFRQDPTVAATYFDGSLVGRADERAWSLGGSLPLDLSGSWKPRAASAASDLSRAQLERDGGLRALDEKVALAVAEVSLQQRLVARSDRLADLQAIAAEAAHRSLDAGQGTRFEADSADLDLAVARVAVEQTRGELARARTQLARLLGRTVSSDVIVEDPSEPFESGPAPDFDAFDDHDPRVRAANAELEAARLERDTFERLITPMPSFGLDYGFQRREIPIGSFTGSPFAGALTTSWPDRDLTFSVNVPLPLFDRQREPRARATSRILVAEAKVRVTRADVRSELESSWAALQAATRALAIAVATPSLIDRDIAFVEQAVRAGAFDAVQRTQALRRLEEAGRLSDAAVRDVRTARAAWLRRAVP